MKFAKALLIFCFLSLLALSSCKKENRNNWTEININCINPYTTLANDSIYFSARGNKGSWPEGFDYHGNFYPENGQLSFSFNAKRAYDYTLYYPSNNYYKFGEQTPKINIGEVNNFTISVVKFGSLQLFMENLDCEENDTLNWKITFLDDPGYLVSNRYWTEAWDGCYGYETAIDQEVPSGYYQFEWKLKEATGASSSGEEILWVPENDTTILEFNY